MLRDRAGRIEKVAFSNVATENNNAFKIITWGKIKNLYFVERTTAKKTKARK